MFEFYEVYSIHLKVQLPNIIADIWRPFFQITKSGSLATRSLISPIKFPLANGMVIMA